VKDAIQKEVVKTVIADYCNALEIVLQNIAFTYEKNESKLPSPQKEVIVARIKNYIEVQGKVKDISLDIDKVMEQDSRGELLRLCNLILKYHSFIKEDSQHLIQYIKTGISSDSYQKDTLH